MAGAEGILYADESRKNDTWLVGPAKRRPHANDNDDETNVSEEVKYAQTFAIESGRGNAVMGGDTKLFR